MILSAIFLKANEIKDNVVEAVENTVDRVLDKHGRKIAFGLIGAMVGNQFAVPLFSAVAGVVPAEGPGKAAAIIGTNLICSAIGAVAANKMDARIEAQTTNLRYPSIGPKIGPKNDIS